jgi:hypothetical protein
MKSQQAAHRRPSKAAITQQQTRLSIPGEGHSASAIQRPGRASNQRSGAIESISQAR